MEFLNPDSGGVASDHFGDELRGKEGMICRFRGERGEGKEEGERGVRIKPGAMRGERGIGGMRSIPCPTTAFQNLHILSGS